MPRPRNRTHRRAGRSFRLAPGSHAPRRDPRSGSSARSGKAARRARGAAPGLREALPVRPLVLFALGAALAIAGALLGLNEAPGIVLLVAGAVAMIGAAVAGDRSRPRDRGAWYLSGGG